MGITDKFNDVKPIETHYNGYRFRSRLEARWAVFFDALGVKYEYEPEGFQKNGLCYLPDFRVQCHGYRGECNIGSRPLYIEVKGKMNAEDAEKIEAFSVYGLNEEEYELYINNRLAPDKYLPILVVGNIPPFKGSHDSNACFSYDCMDGVKGIYPFNYYHIDGDYFAAYPAADKHGRFYLWGDDSNYINREDIERVEKAYCHARQARFEHGETPIII